MESNQLQIPMLKKTNRLCSVIKRRVMKVHTGSNFTYSRYLAISQSIRLSISGLFPLRVDMVFAHDEGGERVVQKNKNPRKLSDWPLKGRWEGKL